MHFPGVYISLPPGRDAHDSATLQLEEMIIVVAQQSNIMSFVEDFPSFYHHFGGVSIHEFVDPMDYWLNFSDRNLAVFLFNVEAEANFDTKSSMNFTCHTKCLKLWQ